MTFVTTLSSSDALLSGQVGDTFVGKTLTLDEANIGKLPEPTGSCLRAFEQRLCYTMHT